MIHCHFHHHHLVLQCHRPYHIYYIHSEVVPPAVVRTTVIEDTHARMDRIEQRIRQLRVSDSSTAWDDLEDIPVASLPIKFRMPEIKRYTGIGCHCIHLQLYSTMIRAHGLDESQMITLFPLSLSGVAQRWFTYLESSRCRTWDDLTQEFLQQFSFNIVIDVSRRELEAWRQRLDESVSSFFSRWWEKIAKIVDRPSEKDQIHMVLRSLQPRIVRHVVRPFADFSALVLALYDVEDGILGGLWIDSFIVDAKGKKPSGEHRSAEVGTDVGTITSTSQRSPRRHQPVPQPTRTYPSYHLQQYRPRAPPQLYDQTYLPPILALPYYAAQGTERPSASYPTQAQPCYATQIVARPTTSYPRPTTPQTSAHFALKTQRQFLQLSMSLSQAHQKLTNAGLLITLAPRSLP